MTSLAARLPLPKEMGHSAPNAMGQSVPSSSSSAARDLGGHKTKAGRAGSNPQQAAGAMVLQKAGPPPYGHRQGFLPKKPEDFGDGGAFPEIHIAQYPLDMGRKKQTAGSTVAMQVNESGQIRYDALARVGHAENRIVHATYQDLVPKDITKDTVPLRPDEKTVQETAERTRLALEKIVSGKIASTKPKTIQGAVASSAQMIRYTPANISEKDNAGAQGRIIKMVQMPVDPMEPAKHRQKKIPRGPGSPPAPVMHSPPRRVTAKEQKEWVIPPCVSNWKNKKGFAIALDKRLAADGRGLVEHVINDKFATFAEAMYTADRLARDETHQRAKMEQALAEKEKSEKEEHLRMLAQRARDERARLHQSADQEDGYREREEIRRERDRERQRDMRMSHMGQEARTKMVARMQDRDISEKIALGLATNATKETLYDQRLFNTSAGMSSGFGQDDGYNLYDKPLFQGSSAASIYRPKSNLEGVDGDAEMDKVLNSKTKFAGAHGEDLGPSDRMQDASSAANAPIQFERHQVEAAPPVDRATKKDVFGIDKFLSDSRAGNKRPDRDQAASRDRDGGRDHQREEEDHQKRRRY